MPIKNKKLKTKIENLEVCLEKLKRLDSENNWPDKLFLLQQRYNFSNEDLSTLLGVSLKTIDRYESGEKTPPPSMQILISLLCEDYTVEEWLDS
jgi:DNA-binding transcriptional regulator YiaG